MKPKAKWVTLEELHYRYDQLNGRKNIDLPAIAMNPARAQEHNQYCEQMYANLTEAGLSALIRFKGVEVNSDGKAEGGLVDIPTEYFRTARTFRTDGIFPYGPSTESNEKYAEKRGGGKRHPTYVDVVANSDDAEAWLRQYRDDRETRTKTGNRAELNLWFQERVRNWPTDTRFPTRDQDWHDAEAKFPNLSSTTFRNARRGNTPEKWRKRGPRS